MSLYTDASLIMYPSGYKEDKIYSLKPTDGSGDLTFTRASTATRVNAEGLIETSPVNLLTYSNTFSDAIWSKTRSSFVGGQSGYDGSSNAWAMVDTTADSTHLLVQSFTISEGKATFSVYAKAGAVDFIVFRFEGATVNYAYFDLSNGTIGTVDANYTNVNITDAGNGWYKCEATNESVNKAVILTAQSDNDPTYAGAGTTAIYIQDAQVNIGATAKPYFPTTDRLNVPRIDYTGGGCGKLLLEPQRTNLLTYSEQFDNAAWIKSNTTVTANIATSPDGTLNADKLVEDTSNSTHRIAQSAITSTGVAYTQSVFAKSDGSGRFLRMFRASGTYNFAVFDLTNGVVYAQGGSNIISTKIEAYANGWYKCSSTFTTAFGNIASYIALQNGGLDSYLGDGTSGVYIYGAQLELGSYPTSYIPTLASSVTRLADAAEKTGISSLIGQTEGTMFLDIKGYTNGGDSRRISISDGTNNNRVVLEFDEIASRIRTYIVGNGLVDGNLDADGINQTERHKIAFVYDGSSLKLFIDGLLKNTLSTSVVTSGMDRLLFAGAIGGNTMFADLQQLQIYKTALTNTEAIALTTL